MPSKTQRAGRFVKQLTGDAAYSAFIPTPLPPQPPIQMTPEIQAALERSSRAIGRLDGITILLPDPGLFIYMYIRKEAVLSSQIEGTQSTLSDLLLFEKEAVPGVIPSSDVQEVSNYRAAMQHGLERIGSGFPVSLRLLREIHRILIRGTRGGDKTPGEFRTSQNWFGGSRPGNAVFVPPPPHELTSALGNLENYLNTRDTVPLLIQAGVAHAQFETIHPFLDGNGRVGRLLITFLLCAGKALTQPLLYLSLYLKRNRAAYYEALQRIRTHGEWEEWILFYLTGIEEVAGQATETARRIVELFEKDRTALQRIGGRTGNALLMHELLKHRAMTGIGEAAMELKISFPTASLILKKMQALDIVREASGRQRDQIFTYQRYIDILAEGTEPIR